MLIVVAAVMVEVFAPSSARSQMPKNVLAYTQYRYTSHTETSSAAEFALSAWSEKFRECGVCEYPEGVDTITWTDVTESQEIPHLRIEIDTHLGDDLLGQTAFQLSGTLR